MKTIHFKLSILFFLSFFVFGFGFQQQSKKVYRELEVNSDVTVEIENQFGALTISSWDQNQVVIEVQITVKGTNEKRLKEKLDAIDIDFSLSPEFISARTVIDEGWGFGWFNSSKLKYQIDYLVKLPKTAAIDIENNYGSIVINALEGKAKIRCDYGSLLIGELFHIDNYLSFDYTSNSSIDYIKGGTIHADYSDFEVSEAVAVKLKADYTKSKFKTVKDLEFRNDYGKLTIEQINQLRGKGDFLTLRVAQLFKTIDLNQEFGSIKVEYVNPSVTDITIDSEYTGINLILDQDWDFTYTINLEFANLKSNLPLQHQIQKEGSTEKNYKGYLFKKSSSHRLQIDSEFGTVKLNH